MTDLELTEVCAKWLGICSCEPFHLESNTCPVHGEKQYSFDPLHNWNDLMTKVVPKLPNGYHIDITIGQFCLHRGDAFNVSGSLSNLPRSVLELVAEKEGGDKMSEGDDICGLCGEPGADKFKHPIHWPGEWIPDGKFVHAECEQAECKRAHAVLSDKERIDFLRTI